MVQSLVEHGASLELQDRDGNTPLHVACQHGWVECATSMTGDISPSKLVPVLETQNWKGRLCNHTLQAYIVVSLWWPAARQELVHGVIRIR